MLSRAKSFNSEQEAKFLQERITTLEKQFAELCHLFGAYSRKTAAVRDKGDELSRMILKISEAESINKSMSENLAKMSNSLSTIGDYGDKRVQYIDTKVIGELSQYESICKAAKEEVKAIFIARDKEMLRKRQLNRIRERNPRNRHQIVQAETELVQATAEVTRSVHSLEEQMTTFERQKLHDVKAILLDFVSTEMGYHAKAIENLSEAYQSVYAIDEDTDLEEFKKAVKLPDQIPHVSKRTMFRNSQSLGSLGSLFNSPKKKQHAGIPGKSSRPSKKHSKSDNNLNKKSRKSSSSESSDSS